MGRTNRGRMDMENASFRVSSSETITPIALDGLFAFI